ncbi:MAG: dephospho-CoA kinase [Candidatus Nomurabacteria bacterium]|jgi:dephospho-CoA kinase|nr:dephospho-CoA kinase [Candidatus Nomurabacteria bacterium]
MKAIKNAKILVLVGMTGSGKSAAVDYLANKGYPKVHSDGTTQQTIDEIHRLVSSGQRHIILDGLNSWTEYKVLKHEFPGETTVLAITPPKALRYKHLSTRLEHPLTEQEANACDYSEIENLEKSGPIAAADYYITNTKSLDELNKSVDHLLQEISFFE